MTNDFVIEVATEEQFASMCSEWTQLLASYDDATIFNTWEWQHTWWVTWGEELGGELYLLLARDPSGKLAGIAPFYRYKRSVLMGVFSFYRIQFIGSSANILDTVRSEYLDFIFDSQYKSVVQALLLYMLENTHWSKALFSDIRTSSNLFAYLTNQYMTEKKCYVRATLKDTGVKIDTTGSFEAYKKSLGKNTRLACYNRRKRLQIIGEVAIEGNSDGRRGIIESLKILNKFHEERWGKQCFGGKALQFHASLVSFDSIGSVILFSKILLNGKPLSVIYNIDYNGVRYNIQLGFTMLEDRKLSMGSLQLGYAIENSFSTEGINYFDLLAGDGKKTFYKEKFKGMSYRLYTFEVIRPLVMRFIYRGYDMFRQLTAFSTDRA